MKKIFLISLLAVALSWCCSLTNIQGKRTINDKDRFLTIALAIENIAFFDYMDKRYKEAISEYDLSMLIHDDVMNGMPENKYLDTLDDASAESYVLSKVRMTVALYRVGKLKQRNKLVSDTLDLLAAYLIGTSIPPAQNIEELEKWISAIDEAENTQSCTFGVTH